MEISWRVETEEIKQAIVQAAFEVAKATVLAINGEGRR